ncbi:MAG: hypothetical protein ACI4UK_11875, partial [Floccifex sp.]
MKKKFLIVAFLFLLAGCKNEVLPTKEDCLEVAMDDANVKKSEVLDSSIKEENGQYLIVFETESTRYEFVVDVNGIIVNRKYSSLSKETEVKEKEDEEPVVEPESNDSQVSNEDFQRALEAACINMGIEITDPQNVKVTMEEGSLVVRYDFG